MARLLDEESVLLFRENLLSWYRANARDLPWRRSRDPYRIWISEIMLQQTRVAAVLDHYARFTERFPDVRALAAASEADVLAQWSGLGYYRRARMMHRAAQTVVTKHGGVFPPRAAELLKLPGIGAYTAAAVASIAFGEAVAVVDGNVERVLTRLAALDVPGEARVSQVKEPQVAEAGAGARLGLRRGASAPACASPFVVPDAVVFRRLAGRLLDPQEPSHFNQAMMELGATICLPRGPLCLQCPVQMLCETRGEHRTVPKKALTPRDAFYGLVQREHDGFAELLLEQRPEDASLMAGMWQLPEMAAARAEKPLCTVKHSITVTNYTVRVWNEVDAFKHEWKRAWIAVPDAGKLPLTGLARKILKRLNTPMANC